MPKIAFCGSIDVTALPVAADPADSIEAGIAQSIKIPGDDSDDSALLAAIFAKVLLRRIGGAKKMNKIQNYILN